jgi:8-oxo-dGTP diphosphatase
MKTRVCSVALIEKDGKILMGNKAPGAGPYPDTWRLPGGGGGEGESLEQALIREVKEEVNLNVTKFKKIFVWEDDTTNRKGELIHYIFNIYRIETEGRESVSQEFPSLKWVEKEELSRTLLAKPSIVLFKEIGYL